jgi:hypothetical protein
MGIIILILTKHSTDATMVTGFMALVLFNVYGFIRQEQATVEAERSRQVLHQKVDTAATKAEEAATKAQESAKVIEKIEEKTNGNLERAINTAAERVKEAAHQPAPGHEAMPRTRQELAAMLRAFAEDICRDFSERAAKMAAEQAAEAIRDHLAKSNDKPKGSVNQ